MTDTVSSKNPRYILGTVTPVGVNLLPMSQPQPLLPDDILRIVSTLNLTDYTEERVQEAIDHRYWKCVDDLMQQGAQSITLAGFPVSAQLSRDRVLELLEKTRQKTGVTVDTHAEASVAALKHFGARRIAVASRWSKALNDLVVAYLQHAGFEVLTITSVGQWAQQAFSMSIEEGVKLAFQLGRQAMKQAPDAQALFLAGGAWRSLAAVPILEEDFKIPVVTNPITQPWRLMAAGVAPYVQGWGRLLAGQS